MIKLISVKASSSPSGYLNVTFLNSIYPFLSLGNFLGLFLSLIDDSLSNIFPILPNDTIVLGKNILSIETIKNENITCVEY